MSGCAIAGRWANVAHANITPSHAVTMAEEKIEEPSFTFEDALEKTGNGVYNVLLAVVCAWILLAVGIDLFGFALVVEVACDLNLTIAQKGILVSLPYLGIILVSYAWGYISDTRGRKYTLMLSLQVSFVLSCISSLSPNWMFLAAFKFFSVCFTCAANSAAYTLFGESCLQRVRNKYMLMMTSLLLLSPAAGAVITYGALKPTFAVAVPWLSIIFKPWRLLIIIQALPSGIGAVIIYFFYESPKFLANWGKSDEALEVLKSMYALNHHCSKEDFPVKSLLIPEELVKKKMSLIRSIYEQSAPLFRPPLAWTTLQLFYIVSVVYITNNTFLIWLPHIMNQAKVALASNVTTEGSICALITTSSDAPHKLCHESIDENVILTLIASQSLFSFLNFIISYLPNRRKTVLISILCMSASSGTLLNLMPEPISSVFFYAIFTGTCLAMGILASFFVDLYPTSYRGMIACLSIMVGRGSAFVGINLVGNLIFHHCKVTFYLWSIFVLSSVVAAWFLPPDKPVKQRTHK